MIAKPTAWRLRDMLNENNRFCRCVIACQLTAINIPSERGRVLNDHDRFSVVYYRVSNDSDRYSVVSYRVSNDSDRYPVVHCWMTSHLQARKYLSKIFSIARDFWSTMCFCRWTWSLHASNILRDQRRISYFLFWTDIHKTGKGNLASEHGTSRHELIVGLEG